MSVSRIVCPWCGNWCPEGPIVHEGRIGCRKCGKRFFLTKDGATTWPEHEADMRYTIRPLDWERTAGNRSHAATLLGDADVEYRDTQPGSYGRFVWMFSQYTAWMPCKSMADGEKHAEAMYQRLLIEGALTLTDQGILK